MSTLTTNQPDPDAITNSTRLPEPERIVQMQRAKESLEVGLAHHAHMREDFPEETHESRLALSALISAIAALVYAAGGDWEGLIRDLGYPGWDGPWSDELAGS